MGHPYKKSIGAGALGPCSWSTKSGVRVDPGIPTTVQHTMTFHDNPLRNE